MKLTVTGEKGVDIEKDMFGIFFEDINYGADGGIYAEMIENRSFEFLDAYGDKDAYYQKFDGLFGWTAYPSEEKSSIAIRDILPLNTVNPHYLHVECKAGGGFANKAYDGICLKKGETATLKFYARTVGTVKVKAGVKTDGGFVTLGEGEIEGTEFKQYTIKCKAPKNIRKAPFAITLAKACKADFDCVSLFPDNAVCGLFRKDLAELLKDLHPGFVRFPGGCVVEGNELPNRYQWKNTVGDITMRPNNWNRWAVHQNRKENGYHSEFCHYNQSLGLGYYEYFLLCEYLGAAAVPVANVGLACQYQTHQLIKRDDPAYAAFIQDVIDLIEFANGPVSSKWGAVRAQMGHPKPFGLKYVGIGNEQWQTDKVDFFERYDDFEKEIHAVYPDIRLLGSAGPTVGTDTYTMAWENYRKKQKKKGANYTYAVDEHYYMEPEWFLSNTHFYDNYPREVKVFSGEYAAHDKATEKEALKHNDLRAAVAEAAFLTGVERNADLVKLSCYAPLFARIGYYQWHPDMIWFDDRDSYGSPSYYVQKLYANCTGTHTITGSFDCDADAKGVFAAVSENKTDKYIKLVNAGEKAVTLTVELPKKWDCTEVYEDLMTGKPEAANSTDKPENIAFKPVEAEEITEGSLKVKLPACSVMLVTLK